MAVFFEVSPKSMQSQTIPGHTHTNLFSNPACLLVFFVLQFPFFLNAQVRENQPFILSQRIGIEIDSIEVEYFNLFPDLDHVKGAVYRKDNLENLQMLVSMAGGIDTTLIFSKLATEELTKYIDKHEILRDSGHVVNWSLLPDYGPSKMNYFEDHGSTIYVYLKDSTLVAGKLMKITEGGLVLWQGRQPTRPNLFPQLMRSVRLEDIKRIERKQDITGRIFGVSLGVGLGVAFSNILLGSLEFNSQDVNTSLIAIGGGALVGAALGFLYDVSTISRRKYHFERKNFNYQMVRKKLEKKTIFSAIYPPELKPVLNEIR